MGIVSVRNLKKEYGDFTAVDGISFDIEQGEIFGFLGPNGAGKTTTINMLIGLCRPTAGTIFIDGIDSIKDIKKAQSIMGVVADESNLYDEMDGYDNLCFCASLYGMRKAEREKRAKELLEWFGLKNAGRRPFRAYSKGMRRKLTIAAGIIHKPKILFLDEPTTGIDVESARQIRSLILDLKRQGTTVFLTTHYIEDAQRICDRIAFIVNGKIVKSGTVEELMENAEKEHIIKLTLNDNANGIKAELQRHFPTIRIEAEEGNTCFISSPKDRLSPILQYLDKKVFLYLRQGNASYFGGCICQVTGIEAISCIKKKRVERSEFWIAFWNI